jgi:hypothetical protein
MDAARIAGLPSPQVTPPHPTSVLLCSPVKSSGLVIVCPPYVMPSSAHLTLLTD